jgi:hypothetical protein
MYNPERISNQFARVDCSRCSGGAWPSSARSVSATRGPIECHIAIPLRAGDVSYPGLRDTHKSRRVHGAIMFPYETCNHQKTCLENLIFGDSFSDNIWGMQATTMCLRLCHGIFVGKSFSISSLPVYLPIRLSSCPSAGRTKGPAMKAI